MFFFVSELTRVSEETSPVTSPVIPPVSESQSSAQSLSQSQNIRTEESERPAEQQPPPLEVPPEPSKAPLHVPMSNAILESVPMTHISTSLAAGGIRRFQITQISFFFMPVWASHLERLLISAVLLTVHYQLLHPQSHYHRKSLWRFLLQWTTPCPSHQVCWHLLAGLAQ